MEDEYESLPNNSPWYHHMMAGSLAGILEHSSVYPLDLIKTRLMCLKPTEEARYTGIIDGFKKMVAKEGIIKTWRGVQAVVVGAGPAHAFYFSAYEFVKNTLSSEKYSYLKSCAYGLAGASATLLHDAIMTPADAIKQRMQVFRSPYKNSFHCFHSTIKHQGWRVLYRAYTTQLTMTLPYHTSHVTVYELTQDRLNPDRSYRPSTHIIAGALGGAVASFITTPLDVCKTVINTENSEDALLKSNKPISKANGLISSAKYVYKVGGSTAFFRGSLARVLFTVPGTAISWSVYEFFKHSLTANSENYIQPSSSVLSSRLAAATTTLATE